MAVGFEVYDGFGKILDTADVLTLALRKTGTGLSIASDAGMAVSSMLKPPVDFRNYTNPVVAINCGQLFGFFGLHSVSFEPRYGCAGPINTPYTYYVFDVSTTIPDTSLGLETYTAAGQRSFSAVQRALRVLSLLQESRTFDTGDPFPSVTHAGKSLAAVVPHWAGWRYWPGEGTCFDGGGSGSSWEPPTFCANLQIQQDYKMLGAKVSNSNQTVELGTITYEDVTISTSSAGYAANTNLARPLTTLVADVTNYPVPAVIY
jgi:hypothetical protein